MIVDILLGVLRIVGTTHSMSIVKKRFIVECHVLCRAEILGEFLCHMETSVGIGRNLKSVDLAALGSDQDGTLGTLGTIEHNCLSTLQEGNLLDFRRKHIVRRTLHTVDNNERHVGVVVIVEAVVIHAPKVIAVPSTDEGIHVFKATHRIILLLQFFHINV